MLRVMSIAAVLVACGSRSPAAIAPVAAPPAAAPAPVGAVEPAAWVDTAPLEQDLPRLVDRALAMYRDIAQALTGDDCAAAAVRLRGLAGRYRDVVVANARVLRDGRARQLRAALDAHGDAFDAAAQAVAGAPAMARCAPDPAFEQAFDQLLAPP